MRKKEDKMMQKKIVKEKQSEVEEYVDEVEEMMKKMRMKN
jgi:hypothetical protein